MTPFDTSITVEYQLSLPFKAAKHEFLDVFERAYVQRLIMRHGGNLSAASRDSGVSRRHLRDLARKYGVYHLVASEPTLTYTPPPFPK